MRASLERSAVSEEPRRASGRGSCACVRVASLRRCVLPPRCAGFFGSFVSPRPLPLTRLVSRSRRRLCVGRRPMFASFLLATRAKTTRHGGNSKHTQAHGSTHDADEQQGTIGQARTGHRDRAHQKVAATQLARSRQLKRPICTPYTHTASVTMVMHRNKHSARITARNPTNEWPGRLLAQFLLQLRNSTTTVLPDCTSLLCVFVSLCAVVVRFICALCLSIPSICCLLFF